jgi:hypothetical protein
MKGSEEKTMRIHSIVPFAGLLVLCGMLFFQVITARHQRDAFRLQVEAALAASQKWEEVAHKWEGVAHGWQRVSANFERAAKNNQETLDRLMDIRRR